MATSKECAPEKLHVWSAIKGLGLIGTGDFTHPAWRKELREKLVPAEDGLFCLREDLAPSETRDYSGEAVRFVLSGEISTIYKKNGKTRKVHHLILLPGFAAADAISKRLDAIGNIRSDGRPILGLDSKLLLQIVLDECPEAIFIPAHIWTPHFSVFGAFSGFEQLEECYDELSPAIFALETGLSSDPGMNWRLSMLDRFTLVSNSDAHSPANLAREANLINGDLSFQGLRRSLNKTDSGFEGTLEFFPEEGKYHLDGHRNCRVRLNPEETRRSRGLCPACGRPVTVGVLNRVETLADRADGAKPETARPYQRLVPLMTILQDLQGGGKKTDARYHELTREFGSELAVLREVDPVDIGLKAGPLVAEAIRRIRLGEVEIAPGYDGEYGRVSVLAEEDRQALLGQAALFEAGKAANSRTVTKSGMVKQTRQAKEETIFVPESPALSWRERLSDEQSAAVSAVEGPVLVVAGPGSGKTLTLTCRVARLLEEGVDPGDITVVTFTRKAAGELRERLARLIPGDEARLMTVGTFHRLALNLLKRSGRFDGWSLVNETERRTLLAEIAAEADVSAESLERTIALWKNRDREIEEADLDRECIPWLEVYQERLTSASQWDLDDLLLQAADWAAEGMPPVIAKGFRHLLVDEFQDINPVQYRLIRALCPDGENLFVIGDPDQSIYGFRGSDPQCFRKLREDYPRAAVFELTGNYRSNAGLVEAASAVIEHNPDRLAFRLIPRCASSPVRIEYRQLSSEKAELLAVVETVSALVGGADMLAAHGGGRRRMERRERFSFGEIGVLVRTGRQAEMIAGALEKEGIPHRLAGARGFLRSPEVQMFIADLRIVAEMTDGGNKEEISDGFLREFVGQAESLIDAERLVAFWIEKKVMTRHVDLRRLSGLARRAERWPVLLEILETGADGDLEGCPPEVRAAEAVSVSTIHAAKGLEFPAVIIAGVEEGLLPLLPSDGSAGEIAEERRLFYVGMTRARERLILMGARTRYRNERRTPVEPSRFLREIPSELTDETKMVRRRSGQGRQMALFE